VANFSFFPVIAVVSTLIAAWMSAHAASVDGRIERAAPDLAANQETRAIPTMSDDLAYGMPGKGVANA
jgi:hypothetical protein